MRSHLNVALAGISGYGDAYLDALLNDRRALGLNFVGVVDSMPERSNRLGELTSRGIPVHRNLSMLFAREQVDLMMIVTPIHLHSSQTCLALSKGAHVLCEKPLAGDLHDAQEMVEMSRATKRFAAIGFQWSFSNSIQSLKRDMIAGVFGQPLRMKTLVYFPRAKSYFRRNDWAGQIRLPDGAGVLDSPVNNATAHYLHNMFYLLGSTRHTSAIPETVQAELYRANAIENYDTAAIRAMSKSGVEILFYTTHASQTPRGPLCCFEFEDAIIEYDGRASGRFVAKFHDGRKISYGHPDLDRMEKIWQAAECVATGLPVACDAQASMAHHLCAMAAQKSSEITDFPAEICQAVASNGEPMINVIGLDNALLSAYEKSMLPSELNCLSWSRPGKIVELGGMLSSKTIQQPVANLV